MVDIRDVRPLGPIWHKRPSERTEKSEDKSSSGQQPADQEDAKDDDDGKPHVDEYV